MMTNSDKLAMALAHAVGLPKLPAEKTPVEAEEDPEKDKIHNAIKALELKDMKPLIQPVAGIADDVGLALLRSL